MKKWILLTIIAIVAVMAMFVGGTYNSLVKGDESVKSAWSQVENVYQRRLDLIPNLVETVKGYAAHEKTVLQAVTEARAKATQTKIDSNTLNNAEALAQYQSIQAQLSSALSRLMVVVEKYPNLKADQNFLALQSQIEGTENRIAVERRRFNEVAQGYNTMRRTFPAILIANATGFSEKAYFSSDPSASVAPKVEF